MIKILKQISKTSALATVFSFMLVSTSFAHVTVKPGEVETSSYTTFNVSVPNEKDIPTTEIRLLIPEGLSSVTPTTKPGWTISTEQKEGENSNPHEGATIASITWSGGSIPKGQRDDFTFSAKTPSQPNELIWKAYQTYGDGLTVAWDKSSEDQPKKADGSPDFSESGPFSVTKVQDVAEDQSGAIVPKDDADLETKANRALYVSIASVVVALISLVIATRTRK